MNIPNMSGKQTKEKETKEKADKKCLSFLVSVKKERQSIFPQDFNSAVCFSAYALQSVKTGNGHIHLISLLPVYEIPHLNLVIAAQVQETLRAWGAHTDTHIPLAIILPVLHLHSLL